MLEEERFLHGSALLLCISLGSLLFGVAVSEIPLGSKLSVEENNSWVSSNGDFAIGFYNRPDLPNQFSVGIRFNSKSIPVDKQIVVWVAGADVTVSNNSYFQLRENGELVLFDALQSQEVWTSKTSQLSVALAFLRDDGNLVLLNEKKDVIWQSFDNPTDALLPGQRLSSSRILRAASQNYVSSVYSLCMNVSGQLQLRWESSITYWRAGGPSHSNLSAVLTPDGSLQLVAPNLGPVWSVFGEDHNDTVRFRFLRLDVDGNLRLYSWIEVSQTWRSVWQAVENQCNVFATCDQRGICAFNASGSPVCTCPFHHTAHSNSKCLVSSRHECKSGSIMVEHASMFLYGIYPVNDSISLTSLDQCKSMCLSDSSCTAVTFTNDGNPKCRMMKTQYVSGYSDSSFSSTSFVKRCSDPIAVDPIFQMKSPPQAHKESYKICIPCIVGAASGTIFVFVVIHLGIGFYLYKRRNTYRRMAAVAYSSPESKCLIMLSFTEIKDLTGNFNLQIGPKMFKGALSHNQPVAVKKLEATIEARKFRAAVSKVGSIYHKGLVKLEGYCCELDHRYLVYEYAKNGSVEKYIDDPTLAERLTWRKRMEICLSVSRAIFYLHTECREFLCHGNLKCENIVLDENFEAKVNEFGLGMLYGETATHRASAQKDVEDFGKIVLILVSGFKEVNDVFDWVYKEWMEGHPKNVVDKRLEDEVDAQELERALRIAFWCLQADERVKPSMGEVVKVLEGTLPVDPPPPLFGCWRAPREEEDSSELGSKTLGL
ncbi:G-type lectin S-receptor-like serine/threonine-protein kinase SD3-1 [Durio zibethinus]|uniref:Receptor-like serine/threonine-protein kinase n=1 Tax=Durio zibethinus TaxID=66656 RepID=A0A6P5YXI2_DURZI|nr:G-type lectin S-receptor-like serine/threonine-protein kinase SD3-1 [Durio zibethinus]